MTITVQQYREFFSDNPSADHTTRVFVNPSNEERKGLKERYEFMFNYPDLIQINGGNKFGSKYDLFKKLIFHPKFDDKNVLDWVVMDIDFNTEFMEYYIRLGRKQ